MEEKNLVANKIPEEKEAEIEKVTFNVEPIQFEQDGANTYTTGTKLRERIDGMFRSVFADYHTCTLQVNNGPVPDIITRTIAPNSIYVNLLFRENDAGGFHMLKRRSTTRGSRKLDALEYALGGQCSRIYLPDADALEGLEEFLPQVGSNGKNKKTMSVEQWLQTRIIEEPAGAPAGVYPVGMYGASFINVSIIGFPVELMLKKIYGDKNEDGESLDYACHLMRLTASGDMLLEMTQVKKKVVQKLYNMIGIPQPYGVNNYNMPYLYNNLG